MSRGVKWTEEMDRYLVEHFHNEKNESIADVLGCGWRTVKRHANLLGLKKDPEFIWQCGHEGQLASKRHYEYLRITGQKVTRKSGGGRPFKKGHRFSGEIEAKRVKAIQDRAWDERVRIIRGWTRKTKWPMVDYGKGR